MNMYTASLCLVIFLVFSTRIYNLRGYVTLNPTLVQVCVGQQFEVMCTTNESNLVWNFVPHLSRVRQQEWVISSQDMTRQEQLVTVNSTSFTFVRTSMQHVSPLVSTLTIINSSVGLNTINVSCAEIVGVQFERGMAAMSTIIVIGDTHTGILNLLDVSTRPVFDMGGVSVTLEWIPEEGVFYNVAAYQGVDLRYTQRSTVALIVPYNTPTNVTITATSCGQNSETAITPLELAYGRCEDPLLSVAGDSVMAVGYRNLTINGTMVTFSCPPGLTLNGSNSVMCTYTGQWEPAPSAVHCYNDTDAFRTDSIFPNLPVTNTTPTNSDNSKETLGISLGVVLSGVAVVIVVTVAVVVVVLMRMKKRGAVHTKEEPRYMRTEHINHRSHNSDQDEESKDTLVYADIGPSSFRKQVPLLPHDFDLDDNAVEYAKLNHNLAPVATTMESKVDDNVLDVNLDILLIQLRSQVTPKWYEFGKAVGIKKEILDNCASKCAPEECIVEILDYWLRNHIGEVTWREVAEALKLISLEKLALEIEDIAKTGKLPVEVDMNVVPNDLVFTTDFDSPPPIPPKTLDLRDNDILDNMISHQKAVPPIPPKGARAMPSFHMSANNLDEPPTDIPTIPPCRPPKP